MVVSSFDLGDVGLKFDNTYSVLPNIFFTFIDPVPVKSPKIILLNYELGVDLNLKLSSLNDEVLANIFSGNLLVPGSQPIAQAYGGHQFGYYTVLGDGRALLIGEHVFGKNSSNRVDVQLKGSGPTPYSRGGDGRAAMGPILREYIVSEAMHSLGIPTTRALAAVETGEKVYRDKPLRGAILTRVASSHIRVGTFQYFANKQDIKSLSILLKHVVDRHYPELEGEANLALALLKSVMKKQIELVVNWMRVGFIHGVMNTDNTTVSGETIDYGPCAFMNIYNPGTVFSSIDVLGRYAYTNQPIIMHWNISRFAESLLPLINDERGKAIDSAKKIIDSFPDLYKSRWAKMIGKKIGLLNELEEDRKLVLDLFAWMEKNKADFNNTFLYIMGEKVSSFDGCVNSDMLEWVLRWKKRLLKNKSSKDACLRAMRLSNPLVIPRNHLIEKAISDASNKNEMSSFNNFLGVLQSPYQHTLLTKNFQSPPGDEGGYKTFCGT